MAESAIKVFLYGQGGRDAYGIKKYIVDDASGVSELPTDAKVGSSCLVIATGDIYMINSQKEWVKLTAASGGSSSGGSEESGAEALTAEEIQAIINEVRGGEEE